jgi:hypothetical protein
LYIYCQRSRFRRAAVSRLLAAECRQLALLSENEREKTLLTNCHLVGIGYWHSAKKESRWIDGREVIYIKEAELYEVSLMSGFASGAIKNAFATYGHVDYSMFGVRHHLQE